MDASKGRHDLINMHVLFCFLDLRTLISSFPVILIRPQTTEGIWIARCTGIEPFTIVMDLEGTDGRERGEDGTLFEKQSALFAIALSDIMLINMWCHDIGREHAANKPLLKIVFQVMLRLCSPRKTTLMFIIRDTTRTPIEILDLDLRKDIKEIWDSVPKAEAHKHTQLSEFFNVEVVALSSYEHEEENFKKQVANLRQKFFQSIAPGGLAGDRRLVVPGSGFSLSAQNIWKDIKENKDLNLPSYRVMVANVRCEKIADEKYSSFAENQDWVDISEAVKSHPVADFGKKLSSLLEYCFSIYDEEVIYYEETVRSEKRKQLEERLMKLVQPATKLMLKYIRSERLDEFKGTFNNALKEGQGFEVAARDCTMKSMRLFDEQCKDATSYQAISDYTKIRDKLSHDLDLHITEVRAAKLNELSTQYEVKLNCSSNNLLSCEV
ncbi:hypothetical protein L1987_52056 [Smallanthus sonchifolius]|uniref:Uncharacterized protein n=1 Tax=Smallanthus sonchifolius TaxID=185202 RepID=A0ACB9ESC6_9ASTR|nr:hypothetical protein L1987_52056 [Smallanthus sonchifolius]